MKNKHYELVSGSIFGVVAALQASGLSFRYRPRWVLTMCPCGSPGLQSGLLAASAYGQFKRHAIVRTKHELGAGAFRSD